MLNGKLASSKSMPAFIGFEIASDISLATSLCSLMAAIVASTLSGVLLTPGIRDDESETVLKNGVPDGDAQATMDSLEHVGALLHRRHRLLVEYRRL